VLHLLDTMSTLMSPCTPNRNRIRDIEQVASA
jgi:hypothetical protein